MLSDEIKFTFTFKTLNLKPVQTRTIRRRALKATQISPQLNYFELQLGHGVTDSHFNFMKYA